MPSPDDVRRQAEEQDKRAQGYGSLFEAESARLSGWLVLGNTGALVLYYQALVGHQICDFGLLKEMGTAFFWGLILIVVATALGLVIRWFSWHFHWNLYSALSDEHAAILTSNLPNQQRAQKQYTKYDQNKFWSLWRPLIVAFVFLLQLGSAFALGLGTTAPLRDSQIQFCATAIGAPSTPAEPTTAVPSATGNPAHQAGQVESATTATATVLPPATSAEPECTSTPSRTCRK